MNESVLEKVKEFSVQGITDIDFENILEDENMNCCYDAFVNTRVEMSSTSNSYTLKQLWMRFLDMIELLLNTIYSVRSGNWELLLECIREIIPFAFAYDNINCARYLTGMLGEMLKLPANFPEIYEEFMKGNFAAQLIEANSFSRSETDKVIEMTLNKDTKNAGGSTGFSTNLNAVKRWEINAAYRANLRTCFHKHLNYQPQNCKHPDLNPSRILKDEADVQGILSTISNTFIDPLNLHPLVSISTGIVATEKVVHDLNNAKKIGQLAMVEFIRSRLQENSFKSFFDPITKQKLATFATMSKIKTCEVNNKLIPLQASKNLFARTSLVAQNRSIDRKAVFQYPLGPLPRSLAEPMGILKKLQKVLCYTNLKERQNQLER